MGPGRQKVGKAVPPKVGRLAGMKFLYPPLQLPHIKTNEYHEESQDRC